MRFSVLSLVGLLFAGAQNVAPDDLDQTYQALREAVTQKDAAVVKKLAGETAALARKLISLPAPEGEDEKAAWTKRVAYGRDVESFSEYALYATALGATPETTIDLLSTLEQQNPKSRYMDAGYAAYFYALNQTGAAAKIVAIAEKALPNLPDNEDLLLVLADSAMSKRQTAVAGRHAERLLAVLSKHPKPEEMTAADWERKKTASLARAYFLAGMAHAEKNDYFQCDRDLRAALPLVKGNEAMLAPTLFYLGLSNYQLGKITMDRAKILEGAKFSEQAAAFKGPLQQQAWTNAHLMKTEADKMFARKK